jgi:hypothetical protein
LIPIRICKLLLPCTLITDGLYLHMGSLLALSLTIMIGMMTNDSMERMVKTCF